jgi:hypothetical protein
MRLFAVVAEALAVVGDDGDERPVQQTDPGELVQDGAQGGVRERDLPIVRVVDEQGAERRRRLVGLVGVIEVQPGEERSGGALARMSLQPAGEGERGAVAPTLRLQARSRGGRICALRVRSREPAEPE